MNEGVAILTLPSPEPFPDYLHTEGPADAAQQLELLSALLPALWVTVPQGRLKRHLTRLALALRDQADYDARNHGKLWTVWTLGVGDKNTRDEGRAALFIRYSNGRTERIEIPVAQVPADVHLECAYPGALVGQQRQLFDQYVLPRIELKNLESCMYLRGDSVRVNFEHGIRVNRNDPAVLEYHESYLRLRAVRSVQTPHKLYNLPFRCCLISQKIHHTHIQLRGDKLLLLHEGRIFNISLGRLPRMPWAWSRTFLKGLQDMTLRYAQARLTPVQFAHFQRAALPEDLRLCAVRFPALLDFPYLLAYIHRSEGGERRRLLRFQGGATELLRQLIGPFPRKDRHLLRDPERLELAQFLHRSGVTEPNLKARVLRACGVFARDEFNPADLPNVRRLVRVCGQQVFCDKFIQHLLSVSRQNVYLWSAYALPWRRDKRALRVAPVAVNTLWSGSAPRTILSKWHIDSPVQPFSAAHRLPLQLSVLHLPPQFTAPPRWLAPVPSAGCSLFLRGHTPVLPVTLVLNAGLVSCGVPLHDKTRFFRKPRMYRQNMEFAYGLWRDIARMYALIRRRKRIALPRGSLQRVHDELMLVQRTLHLPQQKLATARQEDLALLDQDVHDPCYGLLRFRRARTTGEIIKVSSSLHNCVWSYVNAAIQGKVVIVVAYDHEGQARYCLEVRHTRLYQYKADFNAAPVPEAHAAAAEYLNAAGLRNMSRDLPGRSRTR